MGKEPLKADIAPWVEAGICLAQMSAERIVSLRDRTVIERILRHLGLWQQGVRVSPARNPSGIADRVIEPDFDDPFPACLGVARRAKMGLRRRTC